MATTLVISVAVFVLCGLLMGLGMLLKRPSQCMQRGTCGGNPVEVNGTRLTCSSCPKRNERQSAEESETVPAAEGERV